MHRIVSDEALDVLFRRTRNPEVWLDRPVGDILLRAVSELVDLLPTDGEPRPRLTFVRSAAAKARLAAALPSAERALINAPVIAVVAHRSEDDAEPPEAGDMRSTPMSLVFAARALGLDCRPIWRGVAEAIDAAFFPDGAAIRFLCALGYGADPDRSFPARPGAPHRPCEIL